MLARNDPAAVQLVGGVVPCGQREHENVRKYCGNVISLLNSLYVPTITEALDTEWSFSFVNGPCKLTGTTVVALPVLQ